ncbi:MAG: hypothetical protein HC921_00755, partial [Synechococcaceae cyanobacterium SM2_3_1]|nr:hypothetical protein [Synechococcaceae cyanobacterium SM2_3_1]
QVLFWRVALHYSSEISLVDSILEAYKTFQVKHFHRFVSQISIISYLQSESPASGIANLAFQEYISPRELFVKAKLPSWIQPIQDAFGEVTEIFCTIDNPAKHHSQWLIRCFDQMNHELQTRSVERLLLTLPKQTAGSLPDLIQWLREHYGPKGLSLSWHSLSEEARKNLREWIGAASYQDFANLVDRILNKLPLNDRESRQLSRRKDFWSNYSDAFLRIRILIPGKTISYLNTQDFSSDIEILAHDGTDTEVCVFDFGEWFVIEFFRGGGSEIRLFPKGDLETILFNSNNLSVKQLRSLGGEVHDHVFLWQPFCVKWLGRKGIYPNKDITYFRVSSRSRPYFDWKTHSLPEPSQEDQLEREEQLNHWHRHIASL